MEKTIMSGAVSGGFAKYRGDRSPAEYGGDQESKLERAVEMVKKNSEYFSSMEDEEAMKELEGVASAKGLDVDDPQVSASDIANAFYGSDLHNVHDEEE
jgi:hypothetical protein